MCYAKFGDFNMFGDFCGLSVFRAFYMYGDASVFDGLCFFSQASFTSDVCMVSCFRGCPVDLHVQGLVWCPAFAGVQCEIHALCV